MSRILLWTSALTASPSARDERLQAAASAAAFFFLDGAAFFDYDRCIQEDDEGFS
jgi:hypothetical protein